MDTRSRGGVRYGMLRSKLKNANAHSRHVPVTPTQVEPVRAVRAPAPMPPDRLTRFSQLIGRVIPDAMSTAVGMPLLLTLGALAIGNSGTAVMDAFYRGLWVLLPFTMQMTLILVL